MQNRSDVHLSINQPAGDVLAKIRSATEREILPFISASRYPLQMEKEFVAKVSRSRFRIWKVPSATRSRQNICHPYLHGEVRDADGRSDLSGSFALHPFDKVMALLPLTIILFPWLLGVRPPVWGMIFIGFFLLMEILVIGAARRLRPKEEKDIIQFLLALFPDAQDTSTALVHETTRPVE